MLLLILFLLLDMLYFLVEAIASTDVNIAADAIVVIIVVVAVVVIAVAADNDDD